MTRDERQAEALARFGEPKEHRIRRERTRDLAFSGWLLGEGESKWRDGIIRASVYLTTQDRYVGQIDRITLQRNERMPNRQQQLAGIEPDEPAAKLGEPMVKGVDQSGDWFESYQVPGALLEWFEAASKGRLGSAEKDAWEAACRAWPELEAHETERV